MTNEEMSEFLVYRCVLKNLQEYTPHIPVKTSEELFSALARFTQEAASDGKAALALSGGIDSAILAKFMPKGSKAYTFRCVVPGVKVTDESERAKLYADICGLEHEVIDIQWENIEAVIDTVMKHKKAPVHSIEAQIYIAALKAKNDGFTKFIFGESSDVTYGGMNGLLAKDWFAGEFIDRYTHIMPYKVLRHSSMPLDTYMKFEHDGHVDGHEFCRKFFRIESLGSYYNACETAGIEFIAPYSMTYLDIPIDYARIRSGDSKYIVREVFRKLYPELEVPEKIPMPRPVNEWFKNWKGPSRSEFLPHCTDNFSGDQKWMVWCLERYLNLQA